VVAPGVAEEEDAFLEEELCKRREVDICAIKEVAGGRHTVECKGDKKCLSSPELGLSPSSWEEFSSLSALGFYLRTLLLADSRPASILLRCRLSQEGKIGPFVHQFLLLPPRLPPAPEPLAREGHTSVTIIMLDKVTPQFWIKSYV